MPKLKYIVFLVCLLLVGCATTEQQINDCLPAAISAKEVLEKQGVPTKVLVVQWKEGSKTRGHAYAIFRYGRKYSYDKDFGSVELTAEIEQHNNLNVAHWEAWEANWKRGHKGEIIEAYYLEK